MDNRGAKILAALGLLVFILVGCGGKTLCISNRNGEVESGELVLDSIPLRPDPSEYVIGHGDAIDVLFLYSSDLNQLNLRRYRTVKSLSRMRGTSLRREGLFPRSTA